MCLGLLVFVIPSGTPPSSPAPTSIPTPSSAALATKPPTAIVPKEQSAVPSSESTPPVETTSSTALIVDSVRIFDASVAEVEQYLGAPSESFPLGIGEVEEVPDGGESRTYHLGKYEIWVNYDTEGLARGLQVVDGLASDRYKLDDWSTILEGIAVGYAGLPNVQGYLDMSYFALVPPSFKRRRLKIAIVFNFSAFRFEAWLSGANRQVLQKYWDLVKDARWPEYRLVPPRTWADSIVEYDLVSSPDFADVQSLTRLIEKKVAKFTNDMERFLSRR